MTPTPILIDCDPGHDDAIALLLALGSPEVELLGVTTVHGNQTLQKTTKNALRVLELAGRSDIPVAAGADRPLRRELHVASHVHGESGLDGPVLPEPSTAPVAQEAADFLAEKIVDGAVLVPTGPLTNIALLLARHPDAAAKVSEIVLMGGAIAEGNMTPAAEFNVWADPEAAAVVFDYGGPLIQAGLHLTHELQTTPERLDALRAMPNRLGPLLGHLLGFFAATYIARHDDFRGAPVHDVCAVLALTHPDLFTRRGAHVVVETGGQHTRGMTVVDLRTLKERPSPNVDVLMGVDDEAGFEIILDAVASFP
jgi:pyrimidine-specific ribonucleoside hydrolase